MVKEVKGTKYGYARVSTGGQELNTQIEQLKDQGVADVNIYKEKITGANREREQLTALLGVLTDGDTVYITKIDRLARSITDLKALVDEINNAGATVTFIIDNLIFKPNVKNSNSNLMLNMLGSFAEFEKDLITTRMQEGKAYAKRTNPDYKEGRPNRTLTPKYLHAMEVLKENSYKVTAGKTGISTATLSRIKKQYIEETGDTF